MVILDDQILGKPKSKFEAYNYLSALSNRWHEVKLPYQYFIRTNILILCRLLKVKFVSFIRNRN